MASNIEYALLAAMFFLGETTDLLTFKRIEIVTHMNLVNLQA